MNRDLLLDALLTPRQSGAHVGMTLGAIFFFSERGPAYLNWLARQGFPESSAATLILLTLDHDATGRLDQDLAAFATVGARRGAGRSGA